MSQLHCRFCNRPMKVDERLIAELVAANPEVAMRALEMRGAKASKGPAQIPVTFSIDETDGSVVVEKRG